MHLSMCLYHAVRPIKAYKSVWCAFPAPYHSRAVAIVKFDCMITVVGIW